MSNPIRLGVIFESSALDKAARDMVGAFSGAATKMGNDFAATMARIEQSMAKLNRAGFIDFANGAKELNTSLANVAATLGRIEPLLARFRASSKAAGASLQNLASPAAPTTRAPVVTPTPTSPPTLGQRLANQQQAAANMAKAANVASGSSWNVGPITATTSALNAFGSAMLKIAGTIYTVRAAGRAFENWFIDPIRKSVAFIEDATESYRKFEIAISGLAGGMQKARAINGAIVQASRGLPMSVEDLQTIARQMGFIGPLSNKISLGSAGEAAGAVGDFAKIVGKLSTLDPEQGARGVMVALRDAFAGEFRSLRQRLEIPPEALAGAIGKTVRDLQASPNLTMQALRAYTNQFIPDSAMQSRLGLLSVQRQKITDAMRDAGAQIGNSGLYDNLVGWARDIQDKLWRYLQSPEWKQRAESISARLSSILENVGNALMRFLRRVTGMPNAELPELLAAGVEKLFAAFEKLSKALPDIADSLGGIAKTIGSVFANIGGALGSLLWEIQNFDPAARRQQVEARRIAALKAGASYVGEQIGTPIRAEVAITGRNIFGGGGRMETALSLNGGNNLDVRQRAFLDNLVDEIAHRFPVSPQSGQFFSKSDIEKWMAENGYVDTLGVIRRRLGNGAMPYQNQGRAPGSWMSPGLMAADEQLRSSGLLELTRNGVGARYISANDSIRKIGESFVESADDFYKVVSKAAGDMEGAGALLDKISASMADTLGQYDKALAAAALQAASNPFGAGRALRYMARVGDIRGEVAGGFGSAWNGTLEALRSAASRYGMGLANVAGKESPELQSILMAQIVGGNTSIARQAAALSARYGRPVGDMAGAFGLRSFPRYMQAAVMRQYMAAQQSAIGDASKYGVVIDANTSLGQILEGARFGMPDRAVKLQQLAAIRGMMPEAQGIFARAEAAYGAAPNEETLRNLINAKMLIGDIASGVRELELATNTAMASFIEFGRSVEQSLQNSIGDALANAITGAGTLRDVLKSLVSDITRSFSQMAARNLFSTLFPTSSAASGGPGVFTSAIISLLGSPAKAATGAVWQGGFMPLTAFANGGIVDRPVLGIIGEGRHNEAVVPLPNGREIPVEMRGRGGDDPVNVIILQDHQEAARRGLLKNRHVIVDTITGNIKKGGKVRKAIDRS